MSGPIHARLEAVLARFIDDGEIRARILDGGPLAESPGLDSLTLVHMVVAIEKEFDIRFELDTVNDAFRDLPTLTRHIAAHAGD